MAAIDFSAKSDRQIEEGIATGRPGLHLCAAELSGEAAGSPMPDSETELDHGKERKRPAEGGAEETVEALQARIHRGLWPLVAFLALSSWAHTGFRYLPAIPEQWKSFLGKPPPPMWINALFLLYLLSAMILCLMRMAEQMPPGSGFRSVLYLAAFYGFHSVAGSLPDNFWAVLIGGTVLLGLEFYRNRHYHRQKIRELTGS